MARTVKPKPMGNVTKELEILRRMGYVKKTREGYVITPEGRKALAEDDKK